MESFFVKIGDGLIKFCLFFINLFISISDKKSINKSDIDKNKDNPNNPNNYNKSNIFNNSNSSNKSIKSNKFNLNNFKSLFFNEDFQEELIFESLENKSSKSKNKKGFLSFLSSNNYNNKNNNTKTTLSSNNINKLSNSQEKDGFNEFLNNKILFNLKSLSKFGIYFIIIIFIFFFSQLLKLMSYSTFKGNVALGCSWVALKPYPHGILNSFKRLITLLSKFSSSQENFPTNKPCILLKTPASLN